MLIPTSLSIGRRYKSLEKVGNSSNATRQSFRELQSKWLWFWKEFTTSTIIISFSMKVRQWSYVDWSFLQDNSQLFGAFYESEKLGKIFTFPDDRVSDLFLVGSFWPITAIIFGYLYFVTGKGQELMRNRRPFELKNIIIIYNLFQIFLNLYTAVGVSKFELFSFTIGTADTSRR